MSSSPNTNQLSIRRAGLGLFLVVLFGCLLAGGGRIYSPDAEIMFRTSRNLITKFSVAVEPLDPSGKYLTRIGPDKKYYGHYGIGQPLAAAPLVAAGIAAGKVIPKDWFWELNRNEVLKGVKSPYRTVVYQSDRNSIPGYIERYFISLFNPIITALTALVLFLFLNRLGLEKRWSILTALIYVFGTMAWPHSKTFFNEGLVTLWLISAVYWLYCYREDRKDSRLILTGIALGYICLTRMESVIVLPGFFIYTIWLLFMDRPDDDLKHKIVRFLKVWVPAGLGLLGVLGYNYIRYRDFFSSGYSGEGFTTPVLEGLHGLLASPGRGIFWYSPPILLGLISFRRWYKKDRPTAILSSYIILVYILVIAKWYSWAGGWCWGARHIFQVHIFMILPVAFIMKTCSQKRFHWGWIPVILLTVLGVGVQLIGCSASFIDTMLQLKTRSMIAYGNDVLLKYSLMTWSHSNMYLNLVFTRNGWLDPLILYSWLNRTHFLFRLAGLLPVAGLIFSTYLLYYHKLFNVNKK
jgi:dolichyl-phosphate-mannose-protein mannosyltransferase